MMNASDTIFIYNVVKLYGRPCMYKHVGKCAPNTTAKTLFIFHAIWIVEPKETALRKVKHKVQT